MVSKERSTDVLARNILMLLGEQTVNDFAKKKQRVKQRTLNNMARPSNPNRSPQLDNIQIVAKAFGLETWELLLPDLAAHLAEQRGAIEKTRSRAYGRSQ